MCQYRYFVCPIEYSEALGRMTMDCEPSSLFQPQEYMLPKSLQVISKMVMCLINGMFQSHIRYILNYMQLYILYILDYFSVCAVQWEIYFDIISICSTFIIDVAIQLCNRTVWRFLC